MLLICFYFHSMVSHICICHMELESHVSSSTNVGDGNLAASLVGFWYIYFTSISSWVHRMQVWVSMAAPWTKLFLSPQHWSPKFRIMVTTVICHVSEEWFVFGGNWQSCFSWISFQSLIMRSCKNSSHPSLACFALTCCVICLWSIYWLTILVPPGTAGRFRCSLICASHLINISGVVPFFQNSQCAAAHANCCSLIACAFVQHSMWWHLFCIKGIMVKCPIPVGEVLPEWAAIGEYTLLLLPFCCMRVISDCGLGCPNVFVGVVGCLHCATIVSMSWDYFHENNREVLSKDLWLSFCLVHILPNDLLEELACKYWHTIHHPSHSRCC